MTQSEILFQELNADASARLQAKMRSDGAWFAIEGRECVINIEPRPLYCDRGNWIAKLFPIGTLAYDIDESDGWPRYYFDIAAAFKECERWLDKRGQRVAGESWQRKTLP